jgi:TorA maturation chaperone TorD
MNLEQACLPQAGSFREMSGKSPSAKTSENLSIRSAICAVLARGFSYPDQSVLDFFQPGDKAEIEVPAEVSSRLVSLQEAARSSPPEALQTAYMRLFGPAGRLSPCEAEQKKLRDIQKAQALADVMGFYHAFGVEPRGERPDHIASELEFLHYLMFKECYALGRGEPEMAALCREARVKFCREHLFTWTDEFARTLRAEAGQVLTPFYANLVDLLEIFVASEREEMR